MPKHDVAAALALIDSIDLAPVMRRLMQDEGWDAETAAKAERRYRRYLCMIYLEREQPFVPTADIDKVWHQHILFTRPYTEDCERVFGYYLHHDPASGAEGEAGDLQDGLQKTHAVYFELFGEDYVEDGWLSYFLA